MLRTTSISNQSEILLELSFFIKQAFSRTPALNIFALFSFSTKLYGSTFRIINVALNVLSIS